MPNSFLLVEKVSNRVSLCQFTEYTVNGLRLSKNVNIDLGGNWVVEVGGQTVLPSSLSLQHMSACTKENVHLILTVVEKARPCTGKQISKDHTYPTNRRVEHWCSGEGPPDKRTRANKCNGLLGICSTSDVCQVCQNCVRFTKADPEPTPEDDSENIHLSESSHDDLMEILKRVLPSTSGNLKVMLEAQVNNIQSHKNGRRWPKEIIQSCLSLWCRCPKGYDELRRSSLLVLPSGNTLQLYKNIVDQKPGFHDEMFKWMRSEADTRKCERRGGIIFDEMSIQENLHLQRKGDGMELIGLMDMGDEASSMRTLRNQQKNIIMANHMLQFIFLGYDGFRFPIAYFASCGANAPEIFFLFWRLVDKMYLWGFHVDYACMDGASGNRSFIQSMNPSGLSVTVNSIFNPSQEIVMLMDYSHVIKRVRNSILSSGTEKYHYRKLKLQDRNIYWNHWQQAHSWDKLVNSGMRLYQKLTEDHLHPTKEAKMRNHLAEDVLNSEMLHLMVKYKESLHDGSYLDSTINLLKETSVLVRIFRDMRPITDLADERLQELQSVLQWFQAWESSTSTDKVRECLITRETRHDLFYLIDGFSTICRKHLSTSNRSIVPARVNSDVIENLFSQQRALHGGANTNPDAHQYGPTINSIKTTVSKKSNCGSSSAAMPYNFSCQVPLNKRRKALQDITNKRSESHNIRLKLDNFLCNFFFHYNFFILYFYL